MCVALLNKKNCSMAQSFLLLLIQFAGIAKLHSGKLSWRMRYVICLFGILVISFPRCARWPHPAAGSDGSGAPLAWQRRWTMLRIKLRNAKESDGFAYPEGTFL
jgi:hypothetical protein